MDVLSAIRRMGALQIDTISVVARSPYFVLFSRLGEYDPKWLDELLVEKALFEQWAHAASFVPIEDFALFRRRILEGQRESYFGSWAEENKGTLDHVLETVRTNGPMRSADFESEKSPGGWWNWKIEKAALEYWFARGELMVSRRDKFQRVYDLTGRVLPDWNDADVPPLDEVNRRLILNTTLGSDAILGSSPQRAQRARRRRSEKGSGSRDPDPFCPCVLCSAGSALSVVKNPETIGLPSPSVL